MNFNVPLGLSGVNGGFHQTAPPRVPSFASSTAASKTRNMNISSPAKKKTTFISSNALTPGKAGSFSGAPGLHLSAGRFNCETISSAMKKQNNNNKTVKFQPDQLSAKKTTTSCFT